MQINLLIKQWKDFLQDISLHEELDCLDADKYYNHLKKIFTNLINCLEEIETENDAIIVQKEELLYFETNKNNFYNYIETTSPDLKEIFFNEKVIFSIENLIRQKFPHLCVVENHVLSLDNYFMQLLFLREISEKDLNEYELTCKILESNVDQKKSIEFLKLTWTLGSKTFRKNLKFLKKYYYYAYSLILTYIGNPYERNDYIYHWKFSQEQWRKMNVIAMKLRHISGYQRIERISWDPIPCPKIYQDEIHLFSHYIHNYLYFMNRSMISDKRTQDKKQRFFFDEYMDLVYQDKIRDLPLELYYSNCHIEDSALLLNIINEAKKHRIITPEEEEWMVKYIRDLEQRKIGGIHKNIEKKYTMIKTKIILSRLGNDFIKNSQFIENLYRSNCVIFERSKILFKEYDKFYPILMNQWIEILIKRFNIVVDDELEDLLFLFIMAMLNERHNDDVTFVYLPKFDDFLDYDSIPSWIVARTEFIKTKHPHWFCHKNIDPYNNNRDYYFNNNNNKPCKYLSLLVKKFLALNGFVSI